MSGKALLCPHITVGWLVFMLTIIKKFCDMTFFQVFLIFIMHDMQQFSARTWGVSAYSLLPFQENTIFAITISLQIY